MDRIAKWEEAGMEIGSHDFQPVIPASGLPALGLTSVRVRALGPACAIHSWSGILDSLSMCLQGLKKVFI